MNTVVPWIKTWLGNKLMFGPILVFITYATWRGEPSDDRWIVAFELGGALAAAQVAAMWALRRPMHRLMLGANLYLVAGGLMALAAPVTLGDVAQPLRASAVLATMLLVGLVSTVASRGGFIDRPQAAPATVRRLSWALLAVGAGCTVFAFVLREHAWLGASLPIMALSLGYRAAGRLAEDDAAAGFLANLTGKKA